MNVLEKTGEEGETPVIEIEYKMVYKKYGRTREIRLERIMRTTS